MATEKEIIDRFFEEGMRIGTCTDPANREETEKAITECYRLIGNDPPKFFWFEGPLAAVKAIGRADPAYVKHLPEMFYGGQEAYWTQRYRAGAALGAVYSESDTKLLALWHTLATQGGWWIPFTKVCVCIDRPSLISMDENRVLHNESGPSVLYRDGYAIYSWHGVTVPKSWIDKDITLETALNWPNIEQRRCAAEMLGWDKVLGGLECRVIDDDPNPEIGKLIEVDLPDSPGQRFLVVNCPTGRTFALPTDRNYRTAREANAGSYELSVEEFSPEGRS